MLFKYKIIIKVGDFTSIDNIPDEHLKYVYESEWQDRLDKILEVTYDSSGNPTETTLQDYTYNSNESGDQGNPTTISDFYYDEEYYDNAVLEYEGRQLTKITLTDTSKSTVIIEYTYNDQGYRTSKKINSETITYELNGDKVIYETNGTYDIIYSYDIDGTIISFHYDDGTYDEEIYYVRNLQGDITKLLDYNGDILVEYTYDAWGNILKIEYNSSYQTEAERAHLYNRYFYRGYRYDDEVKLYYLNSRFYNPAIGRFINSDGLLGEQGNILGHNMFAYTHNNPVMYLDISGEFPILITLIVVGALVGGGSQYLANTMNGKQGMDRWEGIIGATVGGAIALPVFLYSGPTAFILAVSSGVINGTINEVERSIKYNTEFSLGSAAYDGIIYSVLNLIPFVKGPIGATVESLVIDTAGFYLADKYKANFFNGLNRFDNNVRSELRKSPLQVYEEFVRSVTGGNGSIISQLP